jgi:putative sigma-54 modulation protein
MQIEVHGRNLPVTPPLREYVGKRFQRLDRLFTRECTCDVELAVERNPRIADSQIAEATLLTRGHTLRARSTATDMYAAIDGLADRLRRQVAEISERRADGRRRTASRAEGAAQNGATPEEDEELALVDEEGDTT